MNTDDPCYVPGYLHHLLGVWGRSKWVGLPNLGCPRQAAVVGEYVAPGFPEERSEFPQVEFDALCQIIDGNLSWKSVEILKCKYRYRINKRKSCNHLSCTIGEYEANFQAVIRLVDRLMKEEKAA